MPKTVGVSHHRALWSPDFPPPGCPGDDHPSGPWNLVVVSPAQKFANDSLLAVHEAPSHHVLMMFGVREKFGSAALSVLAGTELSPAARRGIVAIGNFDGVHRGHAELLRQARTLAESMACTVTVVTFDPHPLELLAPDKFLPPLTTIEQRAELLGSIGADSVVVLQTTRELLNLSPVEFFQKILIDQFQTKGIVEGFNFRFGHDRAGSTELLQTLCDAAAIPFRIVDPFALNGIVVSSSRVRDALVRGDVHSATILLNRTYRLSGTVVTGVQRGRTIGFPTANLGEVATLIPAEGVYAVRTWVDGKTWPAAANIGPNPTFGEDARKIEVHLIGFSGDLYGRKLEVEFVDRLRETRKFNGINELIEQVGRDVEHARQLIH